MSMEDIERSLFQLRDEGYRTLQAKIIPTVAPERMIGVRTPALRALAKEVGKRPDGEAFLHALPHRYFDEDQLHAFILSLMERLAALTPRILPKKAATSSA